MKLFKFSFLKWKTIRILMFFGFFTIIAKRRTKHVARKEKKHCLFETEIVTKKQITILKCRCVSNDPASGLIKRY